MEGTVEAIHARSGPLHIAGSKKKDVRAGLNCGNKGGEVPLEIIPEKL